MGHTETTAGHLRGGRAEDPVIDALEHGWGAAYEFDRDVVGRWARRRDGIGGKIRGGNPDAPADAEPDALLQAVVEDYQFHPVRRQPPLAGS